MDGCHWIIEKSVDKLQLENSFLVKITAFQIYQPVMLKRLVRFVFAEELALQFGVARHVTSQLQRAYFSRKLAPLSTNQMQPYNVKQLPALFYFEFWLVPRDFFFYLTGGCDGFQLKTPQHPIFTP